MMSLREQLTAWLGTFSERPLIEFLEVPVDRRKGDFALPCFVLSKQSGISPVLLAQTIVSTLQTTQPDWLERVEATGPYINFFFSPAILASHVISEVLDAGRDFGKGKSTGLTYVVEGRQPNTHKVFHIGHLRNALISEAVSTLLEAAGHHVVRCSYMGDIGAHVAKRLRYYTTFDHSPIPTERVSEWSGEIYVLATEKIAENKSVYEAEIHAIHKRLEDGDPILTPLWHLTAQGCLDDIRAINTELGSTIQREYLESEVEQPGIALVKDLAATGKGGVHLSEGALIVNLEERNLGVYLLLKSNGASLYATKDLALAYLKQKEFQFHKSLYIVATEQIHHFNQLFKTLELIGYQGASELEHIAYGMVELPSGKMSSRAGNVITYYAFRERILAIAQDLVATRQLTDTEKQTLARAVAFGAMKFAFLLPDTFKKIIVDPEQAVSFEGETGPYIQYTHARCCSLLTKAGRKKTDTRDPTLLTTVQEKLLLLHLADFGGVVTRAANEYKPNLIARFLLDLAHLFNTYYQSETIIADDTAIQSARCSLVAATKQTLANGLDLLGIEAVDRM